MNAFVAKCDSEPLLSDLPYHRVPSWSRFAYRVTLLLGLTLLSAGCVSNKYQAASALGAQPQWINANLGGAPLKTRLDTVIIYQGPGSWKKSAYWDEFLITFTNDSDASITLASASLIDYFGTIMPAGTEPWKLEKASRAQRDRYTDAGVSFALNTLGYAALTYGAAGAGMLVGAAMTNTWGGLAAGATIGLVAVPVTALAIYANNQKHRHQIEKEFSRRRLSLPLALAPGETRQGSLFFPMTVGPRSLRLECAEGTVRRPSDLPLPMLAGMHLMESAPPSPTPK